MSLAAALPSLRPRSCRAHTGTLRARGGRFRVSGGGSQVSPTCHSHARTTAGRKQAPCAAQQHGLLLLALAPARASA